MLQVRNETPFVPGLFLFPDTRGVDTLYVVLKSTFDARGTVVRVADAQEPVCLADEFFGDPQSTSLRTATEAHLARPGTDVLVSGHLHAPAGHAVPTLDASLTVGALRMDLRAIGDRQLTGASTGAVCTTPVPFTSMPLRYERAFGGATRDSRSAAVQVDRRNPVGAGFVPADTRDLRELRGLPLPNLEDPASLWQRPGDCPAPVATGPLAPTWLPRAAHVGTYDEAWESRRAPYLPADFDLRYFHVAHPRLVSAVALQGGEPCDLRGFTSEGVWRFALPALGLDARARIAGTIVPLAFALERVHIDADAARVTLLHRATLPCDKRALLIDWVHISLATLGLDVRGAAA